MSSTWDDFALQNNGDEIVSTCVVGRKLGEFISGDDTCEWILFLIDYARRTNKELTRVYRCDSPDEKRLMRMKIKPEENGRIIVSSILMRSSKMKRRVDFMFHSAAKTQRCSICNKIKVQESWIEPDDAVVLKILDVQNPLRVVYAVCPLCKKTKY